MIMFFITLIANPISLIIPLISIMITIPLILIFQMFMPFFSTLIISLHLVSIDLICNGSPHHISQPLYLHKPYFYDVS